MTMAVTTTPIFISAMVVNMALASEANPNMDCNISQALVEQQQAVHHLFGGGGAGCFKLRHQLWRPYDGTGHQVREKCDEQGKVQHGFDRFAFFLVHIDGVT